MKLSESLMTVLITLLCVLPFAWFMLLGKKNAAKSKKTIKNLLKNDQLKLSHEEFWNQNFLGIDTAQNKLVFIKLSGAGNQTIKIDLNDVKSCLINKSTQDFKREKKVESELQSLAIDLAFISKKSDVSIVLYDIQDNFAEDFEMKRAEKWQQLILKNSHKTSHKTTAQSTAA